MSRISTVFQQPGHKALIGYVTVGYPTIEATLKVIPILADCGCDIVELGIPFSDPLADGTTIQKASFHALKNGVNPRTCLDVAHQLRKKIATPLIFMTYFNPVLSYGVEKFCQSCANSGIDGLIIPDLPPDEGSELEMTTQKHGLDLIYLLTPASTEERIKLVAQKSRGFIYLVSLTGVTGTRNNLPANLEPFVARVRKFATQPLCIGFGISTPEQVRQVARLADGVIVGSRLIQLLEAEGDFKSVSDFVMRSKQALK